MQGHGGVLANYNPLRNLFMTPCVCSHWNLAVEKSNQDCAIPLVSSRIHWVTKWATSVDGDGHGDEPIRGIKIAWQVHDDYLVLWFHIISSAPGNPMPPKITPSRACRPKNWVQLSYLIDKL